MSNKSNLNDLMILPDFGADNSIKYYKQMIPVTIHHFYITEGIGDVSRYLDLIQTLKTAEQHDTVFIYLNTEGGLLSTAIQIMSAMKQSNAAIVTCLEGEVCSAGTMIFLSGHKYLVNPNCTFMIHNYSGGVVGKGNEIAAQANYRGEYAKQLMKDVYTDFLTEDEINAVLDGRDIWLNSDQVIERLGNKVKDTTEVDVQTLLGKMPEMIDKIFTDKAEAVVETQPIVKPKPTTKKPVKKPVKKK